MSLEKLSTIQQTLCQQLSGYAEQELVLACSGGVDSIVLLHELADLISQQIISNKLIVCHVNHGLSGNADAWQAFVEQQCLMRKLTFVSKNVNLQVHSKLSLEARAREARYLALKDVAKEKGVVLTAHHQDDQAETFLLALKRGAGIKGLSAMSRDSRLHTSNGALTIVRPLLTLSRQTLVERATELGLEWVEDESNQDQQFDRNFLRQSVLPLLNERWPSFVSALARSSEHCQDAQQLLDEVAQEALAKCLDDHNQLKVEALLTLSPSRFNYVMRYYLEQQQLLMPSQQVLAQVRQQLLADVDKTPQVKIANKWLRRYQNHLVLTDDFEDVTHWQHEVKIAELKLQPIELLLPDGIGIIKFSLSRCDEHSPQNTNLLSFAVPSDSEQFIVRFHHENPMCLPDYRQHSRPLKKVLQELKLAPWQRKRVPLLYQQLNGQTALVAAIGHFVCQPFQADKHGLVINVTGELASNK